MKVKAIIFDVGGTLVRYSPLDILEEVCDEYAEIIFNRCPKAVQEAYEIYFLERERGFVSLREATFISAFNTALKRRALQFSQSELYGAVERLFDLSMRRHAVLVDGARELLEKIKSDKIKIGLVSNTPFPGYLHTKDLQKMRVASCFKAMVYSSDFGLRKPHPAIFKEVLNILKVSPRESVYVGDLFDRDVVGPNAIGMKAILVNPDVPERRFSGVWVKNIKEVADICVS